IGDLAEVLLEGGVDAALASRRFRGAFRAPSPGAGTVGPAIGRAARGVVSAHRAPTPSRSCSSASHASNVSIADSTRRFLRAVLSRGASGSGSRRPKLLFIGWKDPGGASRR